MYCIVFCKCLCKINYLHMKLLWRHVSIYCAFSLLEPGDLSPHFEYLFYLFPPCKSTVMLPLLALRAHLPLTGDEGWLSGWFIACSAQTCQWINEGTWAHLIGVCRFAPVAQWVEQGKISLETIWTIGSFVNTAPSYIYCEQNIHAWLSMQTYL